MTDRADPSWAAAAGLSPAVRAVLTADPPPPAGPLAAFLLATHLPPAALPAVSAADLPPRELHALAAAGGPDVCLIDCPPGTDRLGFAAAAAVEAVRRGERVAVVTGSAADADVLLARLLDADLVVVGRAVGPDEPTDPDHGAAAHTHEAAALRRRLADHLTRRHAAAAEVRHLADDVARLGREVDALKTDADAERAAVGTTPPPKPVGLLGAVKGWFAKSVPAPADDARERVTAAADARLADLLRRQADARDRLRAATDNTPIDTVADPAEGVRQAEAALARFDLDRPEVERALCRAVPVAVGPATALADPLLATADRVIVVAADLLGDDALAAAAGVAPARVLLGTVTPPARPYRNGKSGSFLRPTLFLRLWDRFATHEVWALEGVQLVATLRPHDPAGTCDEPLTDRPEVELRFTPAGDLAAVAFPPTVPLAEAKALLAADLGVVTLAGCGPCVWHDDPDRLAACWPAVDPDAGDWADLGDGVRELVCGSGPDGLTATVTFDRAAGWTRAAAEAWLAERLPGCRAVRLPAPVLVAG